MDFVTMNIDTLALIQREAGLMSTWSIFPDDKPVYLTQVDYPLAIEMQYSGHWGEAGMVWLPIPTAATRMQLWWIADALIRLSGDAHHIFIEGFGVTEDGRILTLLTGS
jgi:hypothetical protein